MNELMCLFGTAHKLFIALTERVRNSLKRLLSFLLTMQSLINKIKIHAYIYICMNEG